MSGKVLTLAAMVVVTALAGCSSAGTSNASGSGASVPVVPTMNWSAPAAVTVGTTLGPTQLNAVALVPNTSLTVPGTYTYTPAAGTVLSTVGTQVLSVVFTPYSGTTYSSATATVNLTVNQATPTVTWPQPGTIYTGTALSSIQLNATATDPISGSAVPGTFSYTPAAGTIESVAGTQTLSATFTPTDTARYKSVTTTVPLSVVVPGMPAYTFRNVRIVGGGYITGIVAHPAQKGLFYVRTDVGGAYRYDSVNAVWTPITDFVNMANSSETGIESIGIDPNDVQRLYLAAGMYTESYGGNCVMLNSHDQGATFTSYTFPFKCGANDNGRNAGERLAVDPNLGSVVYFGTRLNGLWRSTNSGASWSQVTSFPATTGKSGAGIVFVLFVKGSSSSGSATKTIYAGVSATGTGTDPAALYVSNDSGATWSAVANGPTGLYVNHGMLGADGNLYFSLGDQIGPVGLTTGKILQYVPSSSGGAGTWNDITPPRSSGYQGGYGGLALDPEAPGTIMVSTLDHYYPGGDDLWRSLDYGKTWYSVNTVGAVRDVSLSPWVLFGATSETSAGNWPTALAIDPFNSNHVLQGNGETIFTTSNMTDSDAGKTSNWSVGALGIEQTVITGLISPPSGPANLLSVMRDLDGFEHTDLTQSPAAGAFPNPRISAGTGIDFAQSVPADIVRIGTGPSNGQYGGYSTNSGATWTPFTANPAGVSTGGGTIAISCDGKTIVWSPSDSTASISYTATEGTAWTASTGAPKGTPVLSDRVNPKVFYTYDRTAGTVYTSSDSGATFTVLQSGLPQGGVLNVAYDAEGSLYLATPSGLFHASKGASFTQVSSVQSAYLVTEGAPRMGSAILTLFVGGTVGGVTGIFRSTDNGSSWVRVDDASHEFGYINVLAGDERVYGRVYIGTGGRGIVYADSVF